MIPAPRLTVTVEPIARDLNPGVRSTWGFMHAPLARHGDTLYALALEAGGIEPGMDPAGAVPWKQSDGRWRLFEKRGDGPWQSGFRAESQQTGCLLLGPDGRLHVIGGIGPEAWTAPPDDPAAFRLQRLGNLSGHPYHGAGIDAAGNILVSWAEGKTDRIAYYAAASDTWTVRDAAEAPDHTGYPYVLVEGRAAHVLKHEAVVRGPKFCYGMLHYLFAEDAASGPWQLVTVEDVAPGHVECQSMFRDRDGAIHLLYRRNRRPYESWWDARDPDQELVHAILERGAGLRDARVLYRGYQPRPPHPDAGRPLSPLPRASAALRRPHALPQPRLLHRRHQPRGSP